METLVLTAMLLVVFGFVVKLSFHGVVGIALTVLAAAVFTYTSADAASARSSAEITAWLSRPDLMLDTAVLLVADVFMQIVFCVLSVRDGARRSPSRVQRWIEALLLWIPGLLIFPVLFAVLVELIFALPGVDFDMAGLWAAAGVLAGVPLLVWALKFALPEKAARLELLFLVNCLTAAIGVVATVNGRTAVQGTAAPDFAALAAVGVLFSVSALVGFMIYRYYNAKKIIKLQ